MPSIAEEEGLPFEARCAGATTALRQLWILFQNLSTEDLVYRQEKARKKEEFIASFSEKRRDAMREILASMPDIRPEMDELFYKNLWASELQWISEVFGDDAKDFALKTIEAERSRN